MLIFLNLKLVSKHIPIRLVLKFVICLFYGQTVAISQQILLGIFNSAYGNEIRYSFHALSLKITKTNKIEKEFKVSRDLLDKAGCSKKLQKEKKPVFFPLPAVFFLSAHKTVLRTVKMRDSHSGEDQPF